MAHLKKGKDGRNVWKNKQNSVQCFPIFLHQIYLVTTCVDPDP